MKKYYITGVPGIGKTTVLNELKKLGYATLDIDYIPDLCQWVNRATGEPVEFLPGGGQEWENKHTWVCSQDKLAELIAQQDAEQLFVCGLANNQADYLALFDKVFLLQADEQVFLNRMASRDADHFGYHESDRRSVLSWYKDFETRTLRHGGIPIDASQPIEQITADILEEAA